MFFMTGERESTMSSMCTQSVSLKQYLVQKYGERIQRTVADLGKELKRESRYLNHHHFNIRCNKSGIIPPSLQIKSPVNTERARSAAKRAAKVFLQERVKTSWRAGHAAKTKVDYHRRVLQTKLTPEDYNKVTSICERTAEATFIKFKQRQIEKFTKLQTGFVTACRKEDENLRTSWLVNLSKKVLTEEQKAVLSKGPNFAVTPKVKPTDFAAPIEAAMQLSDAEPGEVERARIKICEAITRARKIKNMQQGERKAVKDLCNDEEIKILQADKGNATVILDAADYDKKVHDLLDDEHSYTILRKEPTKTTERKLLALLRNLRKQGKINEVFYNSVRPSEGSSKPARFYGKVKLHKPLKPLRPVVATRGTATYSLAKRLSKILRPLVGKSGRVLRNTADLVESMEDVTVDETELLVSFDVKSLFTSIPVNEAINICRRKLEGDNTLGERTDMSADTIVQLLSFCLKSTEFQYDGTHYRQLDGVAMGSPVSPVIADIFMEDLEDQAFLSDTNQTPPRLWKRFVDDVISVIKKQAEQSYLDFLNKQHERIVFTMEPAVDGVLPFMDVRFRRMENGKLSREVYRKPTHTNRYVQFESHHPMSVKAGIVKGLVERALKVSSDSMARDRELNHISETMQLNGYPRKFVKKAIKMQQRARETVKQDERETKILARIPFIDGISQEVRRIARAVGVTCSFYMPDTLRSMYNVKDRLPRGTETHVVYSIECKTCGGQYIGETQRALAVREKEHREAVRLANQEKSAVAEHVYNQTTVHEIDWNSSKIIDRAVRRTERKIRESFAIHMKKPVMNRDEGYERSTTWNAIL